MSIVDMGDVEEDGFGSLLYGPDGNAIIKIVVPEQDLPHGMKVDRSNIEGWPDVEREGDVQTMVALRIPPEVGGQYGRDAESLVDLEPLQNRHITLVYIGKQPPGERQRLHHSVRRWIAESEWQPMEGRAQGWGTFTQPGKKDRNVLWMGWDIPGLADMRHDLKERLTDEGFECRIDHDFVPHETVGYTDDAIPKLPKFPRSTVNHTFGGIVVAEDDEWTEYPFQTGPLLPSGRKVIVAALEAAASEYERSVIEVLESGLSVAIDSALLDQGGDGFRMFGIDAGVDGASVVEIMALDLMNPMVASMVPGMGGYGLTDVVVASSGSVRPFISLPSTALFGVVSDGSVSGWLEYSRGERLPVTPRTPTSFVAQFLRSDGAVASFFDANGDRLLASAMKWQIGGEPALVVGSVTASEFNDLRRTFDASGGRWSALVAVGSPKGHTIGAARLHAYWTVGRGGTTKIRWNTPGDWKRCYKHLFKYLGPRAAGYCTLRHKEMTGLYTGDMRHRILYGWGGKSGAEWARIAARSRGLR